MSKELEKYLQCCQYLYLFQLEKYLQCCWYSEASIHCITAPDPLLPKTFRQRQSNVSPELMRKLERSLLQDPVSSFFLRIESLILLILPCIRIADCPAMCVVCSLPQIPVCVIWRRAVGPLQSRHSSFHLAHNMAPAATRQSLQQHDVRQEGGRGS